MDDPSAGDWEPRAGDLLGDRYELLDELGRGGSGVVFRARDRIADGVVAIKVLPRSQVPDAVARLRRELHAARKISHPGVVRIHDLIELGGRMALSMEFVEGETLADRVSRTSWIRRTSMPSPRQLIQLGADLARALAAAHRAGVTHRDLKPANIIMRATTDRAVITDFGLSRPFDHPEPSSPPADPATASSGSPLTRDGEVVGTPLYMAPEQLLGRPNVGPAADVYALGLVLYEAATGARPHAGTRLYDFIEARRRPAPPLEGLRHDLPAAFCKIVARCLAPEPTDRYPTAVEARDALVRLLEQHRGRRIGAAIAMAVATVALAAGLLLRGPMRAQLPSGPRRVAILASNLGAPTDDWLAPAVSRLALRKLREGSRQILAVEEASQANLLLRLTYRRTSRGMFIEASVGSVGAPAASLANAEAPSIAEAIDGVLHAVVETVGAGQPPRPPDEAERAEMQQLGTTSLEAYRAYKSALDQTFGAILIDAPRVEKLLEETLRLDPGWPHAHALLTAVRGPGSSRIASALLEALAQTAGQKRDPVGRRLLEAMDLSLLRRNPAQATQMLSRDFDAHPLDVLCGWALAFVLERQSMYERAGDVYYRLHVQRPDLQFGSDLSHALRRGGRADEVPRLVEAWRARAPENEQALGAQVALDLEREQPELAVQHARDLLLLHGKAPQRLATLADVMIVAELYREADPILDELARGSAYNRSLGAGRIGHIAILEGRFAAAYHALRTAAATGEPFGILGEVQETLESLRVLAPVLGRADEVDGYAARQELAYRVAGDTANEISVAFERKLAQAGAAHCPDLRASLAAAGDPDARDVVGHQMLRAAAAAGCARCADVVHAGLLSEERSVRSIFEFGTCAENEGALGEAEAAFRNARRVRTGSMDPYAIASPYHSMLARYHLARVLERQGRTAEARAEYAEFVRHWSRADTPIVELEDARRALARLEKSQ